MYKKVREIRDTRPIGITLKKEDINNLQICRDKGFGNVDIFRRGMDSILNSDEKPSA